MQVDQSLHYPRRLSISLTSNAGQMVFRKCYDVVFLNVNPSELQNATPCTYKALNVDLAEKHLSYYTSWIFGWRFGGLPTFPNIFECFPIETILRFQ
jgi:hypothetical protein